MNPIFEAKYIAIKWDEKQRVSKIEEATDTISIEVYKDTAYSLELQTYRRINSKLDAQVAFHILDDLYNTKQPYFINANNEKIELLEITDPKTQKKWWIENGNWNNSYKYRESPLWNHVGEAKIIFGDIICNVAIRAMTFTQEQLASYLEDFKNDFFLLIFDQRSITQANIQITNNQNESIKLLKEEEIKIIDHFIEYAANVLKNPKKELKEVQRLKDIKHIKPVARTFMEIATSGLKRKLTSRDTTESYNVSENKYIYYAIWQTYIVLFRIQKVTKHMKDFYKKGLVFHRKRLASFSDKVIINKEKLAHEIENLEFKVNKEKQDLEDALLKQGSLEKSIQQAITKQPFLNNQNTQMGKFIIQLERSQQSYDDEIQFSGKIKKYGKKNWDIFNYNDSLVLKFKKVFFGFLEANQQYEISAYSIYNNNFIKSDGGVLHEIFFNHVIEMIPSMELTTITIYITSKKKFGDKIQCDGKAKLPNGQWYTPPQNSFYKFEFDDLFDSILDKYQTYNITACIVKNDIEWNNEDRSGIIFKRYFKYINNIELIDETIYKKELRNLKFEMQRLKETDFERPLTLKEKEEQKKEKFALDNMLKQMNNYEKEQEQINEKIKPQINKLNKLLKICQDLRIKKDSYFPNSMTFVQNPNYQNCHTYYKKIKNIKGIDENLFLQLQTVENMGIVNIPTLYERWCLLQIIKVLIYNYNFIPEENWKLKFSSASIQDVNKVRNIKIKFFNKNIKREIDLKYECELTNSKKRPDFILDIKSTKTDKVHRLIMDAKFHENTDIEKQIDLLYYKKNYSEDSKNTVFILHPDKKAIKFPRTPTKWGDDSFYGETDITHFEWDKDNYPNHKYGAIVLSPFNEIGNFLDNLQRIIGLTMQYNSEENDDITYRIENQRYDAIDPIPREEIFCLVCGSSDCTLEHLSASTPEYPNRWKHEITCQEINCGHFFEYNYCWNCKHRLIKNARYWSYHSLQILNEFDVKCPYCNKLLSELPRERK